MAALLLTAAGPVTPIDSYAAPGRMVSVAPGRSLNLRCSGRGAPTVVLEAGFQSWSFGWNKVQPRLAQSQRVCSYDRAGLGLSPPDLAQHNGAPLPRDGTAIAADLAALLKASGEKPPYILVGHSAGGLYVRRFADSYPSQVLGLVLVDPSVEDQFAGPSEAREAALLRYRRCAAAAQAGKLPSAEPELAACVPAAKPGAFNAAARRLATTPGYWTTLASEYAALPATAATLGTSYGAMPLIVLTAGGTDTSPEARARLAEWAGAHRRLAARSTRGTQLTVPGATHLIQRDAPEAVLSAIAAVTAMARE